MSTDTGAISPKIEQLRLVRSWSWRLIFAFLLLHYMAGLAEGLLYPQPDFVLVKVG